MTFFHDTPTNVATLARLGPFPTVVAHAWLRCEGQTINNPSNPLNILYYHRIPQTGSIGRFATYASPTVGLQDAVSLVHRLTYYAGIRRAITVWRAHPTNETIINVARAIEDSPWAAGHYGGGGSRDGIIVRYVRAHLPPMPAPSPSYFRVMIRGLTPVYDAANGRLLGHVSLATYTCTRYQVNGQRWYRIVAPSTSKLYHRWMPAEPTMTVTPL